MDTSFDPGSGIAGSLKRVWSIAVKSNGSILIGGQFTTYNGISRQNIAQLNPDGTLDTSFDPGTGPNSMVRAILVKSDNKILIGGFFNTYNGVARRGIAGLNVNGSLDTYFDPGTGVLGSGKSVNTITQQGSGPGGKIIIGGSFITYNNVTKNNIARLNSDGTIDNTFISGSGTNDEIYSLAIQADGKIAVGGSFTTFNGSTRNRIARLNFNGNLDFSFNPGVGMGIYSAVYSIIPLSNSKLIIGGSFIAYGGVPQNSLSRINSNGTLDLSFNSGSGARATNSISVQSDGQLIIGGNFYGYDGVGQNYITRVNSNGILDLTFNPPSGGASYWVDAITLQPDNKILLSGKFSIYDGSPRRKIARANADGSIDHTFDALWGPNGNVFTIAVQSNGKIVVGGDFNGFADRAGIRCIARLNANGTLDTTFNVGGIGASGNNASILKTVIQSDGKILIGGHFTSYNGLPTSGVVRLNSDGSIDNTFNQGTISGISDIAIQPDGKIILVGGFNSYNGLPIGRIIRLNTDGSIDNSFNAGSGASAYVYSVCLQPNGKILISGTFTSYNGTPIKSICRINTDGTLDNTFDPGTSSNNNLTKIVGIQTDGKIIIHGGFTVYNDVTIKYLARINDDGSLDATFDSGTGPNYSTSDAAIQPDGKIVIGGAFTSYNGIGKNRIARVLRNCVNSNSGIDSHVACGSFTWNDGKTYTSSNNTATYTLFDASTNGCDSIVTLNLTILPLGADTVLATACNSYTWTTGNGQTYTSSALITDTISGGGVNGCDSLVVLNLTILNSGLYTDIQTACESFTWIDNVNYTQSNNSATYIFPGGAANGCDSIITLNLTINQATTGTDIQTACGSFTWIDNITYTQSNNSATHTIVGGNSNGCDSIVTLNLTVNQPTTGTDIQTACGNFTWIDNINYTQNNNTATHILVGGNSNGCDSIVTLNLTVLPIATRTDVHLSCRDPFVWLDGITYNSSNNTATHTVLGAAPNGCDSVITLKLTVIKMNPVIYKNGDLLYSNYTTGDLYEWIDCSTNEVVFTGKNFYPTTSGNYKVRITKDICSETTTCTNFSNVGIEEISSENLVIYPNPTNNMLNIEGVTVEKIRLLALSGQELLNVDDISSIDVSFLSAGCYLVEINNSVVKMFTKQ